MKHKYIYIAMAILLAFLFTAWQASTPVQAAKNLLIRLTFTIQPDGSGEVVSETNTDLARKVESTYSVEEDCKDDPGSDTIYHLENRSGTQWCISEDTFNTLDDIGYYGDTVNRLEILNDQLFYDLDTDFSGGSIDVSQYNVEWKVVAPGKITDHNADQVSGCTLTWLIDEGVSRNFAFTSKTDGKCSQALLSTNNIRLIIGIAVVCCCLLLVVVIVVVVFLVMKRKPKQPVM